MRRTRQLHGHGRIDINRARGYYRCFVLYDLGWASCISSSVFTFSFSNKTCRACYLIITGYCVVALYPLCIHFFLYYMVMWWSVFHFLQCKICVVGLRQFRKLLFFVCYLTPVLHNEVLWYVASLLYSFCVWLVSIPAMTYFIIALVSICRTISLPCYSPSITASLLPIILQFPIVFPLASHFFSFTSSSCKLRKVSVALSSSMPFWMPFSSTVAVSHVSDMLLKVPEVLTSTLFEARLVNVVIQSFALTVCE